MGPTIPMWLMPVLTGICVALFAWMLSRQAKRDECMAELGRELAEFKLQVATEYFGKADAEKVSVKLDTIVSELHSQNLVLTEVRTELRATRQATQMASQHHTGAQN